ncbi:MAG: CBS domain-containing protein [Euryarchaeota archaeon]|nr:CBS domain-containing protein [Euryarchaeota archaeon]
MVRRRTARELMIRRVYTIEPDQMVALAKLKMLRHGIGALPVVDGQRKLLGIITMRDIDLAGSEVADLAVVELMTTDLVTVGPATPARRIADLMVRTGLQRIPVVDPGARLLGLVTQTTIINAARPLL